MGGTGTGWPIAAGIAPMAIAKSSVVAFCNKAWQTAENENTSTLFDQALLACLADLSKLPILRAVDETQALADGDYELDHPDDLMPGGLISITLTDVHGNVQDPLLPFTGGLREYRLVRHQNPGRNQPLYYVEGDDRKWYVWQTANAAYDVRIEYYRVHPPVATAILLPPPCSLAVKTGTMFFEAKLRRNPTYQAIWDPLYRKEFDALAAMYPGDPRGAY